MRRLAIAQLLLLQFCGTGVLPDSALEARARTILERSPGDGADYILNEGFASYWFITEADKRVLERLGALVSRQQLKPVAEVCEQWPFIVKDRRGRYRLERIYVCLPETDPTRPLCPEGYEFEANSWHDNGPSTYTGIKTGRSYVAESWNGPGNCSVTAERLKAENDERAAKGEAGVIFGQSFGPVKLRTTARDYPAWLEKQRAKAKK